MEKRLRELQTEIYRAGKEWDKNFYADWNPRLMYSYAEDEGLYEVCYFGHDDGAFDLLLEFLSEQENADRILSLSFDGPDQGENGTTTWDFTELANSAVVFPNLKSFKVKLTDPGDHNYSIIQESYGSDGENGMIAKLLKKMPLLEKLVVPSAPDSSFFEIGSHPLLELVVQVGYDNQGFIEHFARSNNFSKLTAFDFADMADFYPDDSDESAHVGFDAFRELFSSAAFSTVKHFKLRDSILSRPQLFALQDMRPDLQFLRINGRSAQYVSHIKQQENKNQINILNIIAAANAGELRAQETLATLYATGDVVPKDEKQALYWRIQAADNGSAHNAWMLAQYHYGLEYSDEYNPVKARDYLIKAAELGFEPAKMMLQKE